MNPVQEALSKQAARIKAYAEANKGEAAADLSEIAENIVQCALAVGTVEPGQAVEYRLTDGAEWLDATFVGGNSQDGAYVRDAQTGNVVSLGLRVRPKVT